MTFTSTIFLFFILPTVLVYWRLPQKYQSVFLLIASYIFVCASNYLFALSLAVTTLITYSCARLISQDKQRKLFFLIGIAFLFGQLIFCKYLGLFGISGLHILIPLGLSFYTFVSAGYLIDIYSGKSTFEAKFHEFALFVSFFPTLTAGPIERSDHLLPQFKVRHTFEYSRVVHGLELFTFGLFKKLVIADNLGTIVDSVFSNLHTYRGLSLIITMIFFSWQLYYDFSGYSDMARGIAKILGFDIFINFKTPYFASSVQDFWRRWHISLSNWFRDYLYFPLGGSRFGLMRTIINVLIVFTLCGLWHGAALTFVIWGILHGALMAGERLSKSVVRSRLHIPIIFSMLYTYCAVTLTWIFFRSATLADALYVLQNSLVGVKSFFHPQYVFATMSQLFDTNSVEMVIVCGALVMGIVIDYLTFRYGHRTMLTRIPTIFRFFLYAIVIVSILMLRQANIEQFIYVQF